MHVSIYNEKQLSGVYITGKKRINIYVTMTLKKLQIRPKTGKDVLKNLRKECDDGY